MAIGQQFTVARAIFGRRKCRLGTSLQVQLDRQLLISAAAGNERGIENFSYFSLMPLCRVGLVAGAFDLVMPPSCYRSSALAVGHQRFAFEF